MINKYGTCSRCNCNLQAVCFEEEEYKCSNGAMWKTGRKRQAVDYLICPNCRKKECVDDSFDENWH